MTTPTSHAGYQIAGQTSHPSVAAASISPAAMGSYPTAPASHSFSEGYSNTNYSSPAQGHNHRGSHSSGYRGGRGRRGRATRGGRPDHATDAFGRSLREGDRRSASPPPRADAASQYRRGGAGAARSRSPPREHNQTRRTPREQAAEKARIAARINAERVCRTLFVRNIKYTYDSSDLRKRFEQFGDIKNFFDLVANRGMVFVTFFDVRAATQAKQGMQGFNVLGRPIDVHYSLPRPDEAAGNCGPDKNQASVRAVVIGLRGPLNEGTLGQRFERYGEISTVYKPLEAPSNERIVEFFDMRATEEAIRALQGAPLLGGHLELQWAWDATPETEIAPPPAPVPQPMDPRMTAPPESGGYAPQQPSGYYGYAPQPSPRDAHRSPPPQMYGGYPAGPPPSFAYDSYGPPPPRDPRDVRGDFSQPPHPARYDDHPPQHSARYDDYPPPPPAPAYHRGGYEQDRYYQNPHPYARDSRQPLPYPPRSPMPHQSPPEAVGDSRQISSLLSSLGNVSGPPPPPGEYASHAPSYPPADDASRLPPAVANLLASAVNNSSQGNHGQRDSENNVSDLLALLAQQNQLSR